MQRLDVDLCDANGVVCVRLREFGVRPASSAGVHAQAAATRVVSAPLGGVLEQRVKAMLVGMVSSVIKVKPDDIDGDTALSEYGFDSISLTEFGNALNQRYHVEVKPTIFFEYPTLDALAGHLAREHHAALAPSFAVDDDAPPAFASEPVVERAPSRGRGSFATSVGTRTGRAVDEPIAIVGISGQFPMAPDIDAFWRVLAEGRDCIGEVPRERWDWRAWFGDPLREENRTNVKWGGFIDGIDAFDPVFFGISRREAELMDPQQRLMMIHVWKALEDAGHAGPALAGSDTAIYVGTGAAGYGTLLNRVGLGGEAYSSTGGVPSVGPNRMSYFLDWHGPSEPVETACSSSLIALRRAILAIRRGDCRMAVAGGVNTIVTPEMHISFAKAGMLSEDGRCKTFSSEANGYVRGEGVAMLVLKKLSDAERDGDHIHGLVRGSAENHGGRANSLTAPNPTSQAAVITKAHLDAGIDPRTVTYIEAHGTGTPLGDPVEINGLKAAFKSLYAATGDSAVATQHCGLGSVKTNIGHLELAAGVAGVVKVLLQMKHRTLVRSLHSETLNPYIDLDGSPFYVVQEAREWTALRDAHGAVLPRRAGVSSFGFGGVNAHVVLEEYTAPEATPTATDGPVAVVLSARNDERLREQVQRLSVFIDSPENAALDLHDLAYTLQVGREAMEERLGVVVGSLVELRDRLERHLAGHAGADELHRGQVRRNREAMAALAVDQDMAGTAARWVEQRDLDALLELWVKGYAVDWNGLHRDRRPRRLSLPTYRFANERYWVPGAIAARPGAHAQAGPLQTLHPLVHRNTSDLAVQRYSSSFDGEEFFLADHRIDGLRTLPAVAQLEMALAAARDATHADGGFSLAGVTWARPPVVGASALDLHLTLHPESDGVIRYEIRGDARDGGIVHGRGHARPAPADATTAGARHDLTALRARCDAMRLDATHCHAACERQRLHLGPAFNGLVDLSVGHDEVLAHVIVPASEASSSSRYELHPSLLAAAVQAALGLLSAPATPVALESLDVLAPCGVDMWAFLRYSAGSAANSAVPKLDIDLCDPTGLVCVRLTGLALRASAPPPQSATTTRTPSEMTDPTGVTSASRRETDDAPSVAAQAEPALRAQLRDRSVQQVKKLIAKGIKLPVDAIGANVGFDEYGIDSILVLELTGALRDVFGVQSISTTLFFEHPNIESLVEHFMRTETEALMRWTGLDAAVEPAAMVPASTPSSTTGGAHRFGTEDGVPLAAPTVASAPVSTPRFDVAIVGLSGRYPGAADVDQFWDNLVTGRNCISEIPPERWDNDRFFDARKHQPGKTYSRWAGLLDDVDCFDRLFFNITPDEARLIGPQERLFIQEVHASLEDAGYTSAALGRSRRIGLFVGVTNENYATGVRFWSIANRVSHWFNFQGPSPGGRYRVRVVADRRAPWPSKACAAAIAKSRSRAA